MKADPVDLPLAQLLAEVKAGTRITFRTTRPPGRIFEFMRAWFRGVELGRLGSKAEIRESVSDAHPFFSGLDFGRAARTCREVCEEAAGYPLDPMAYRVWGCDPEEPYLDALDRVRRREAKAIEDAKLLHPVGS